MLNKNKIFSFVFAILLVVGLFSISNSSYAYNFDQMQLSAYITAENNQGITNGEYEMRFALYSSSEGGTPIWQETQDVFVENGIIQADLGSSNNLPDDLKFDGDEYYLGIKIEDDSEMTPRKKLTSVVFAMNSKYLQGKEIGEDEGDILTLGNNGKIDLERLPTGTEDNELVLGDDDRLHIQNTDTGTDSLSFNIGNDTEIGTNNFNIKVSSATNKPALRFNGTTNSWQFSNDGTSFQNISDGTATGTIDPSNGGTGIDTSSAANGELLIGNGSGLTLSTLTGTANQINISNESGSITLSTPQDIATTSSPTFAGLTLGGNIAASSNNSYDIGTSTSRFQELYLGSTGLHIGSDGDDATISYNTDTDQIEFGTSISSFSISGGLNIAATDSNSSYKQETDDSDFGAGIHSDTTTSATGVSAKIKLAINLEELNWVSVDNNWLSTSVSNGYSIPAFADIDNDGDYDLAVGNRYGLIEYFRNDGDAYSPSWTHVSDDWLPVSVGSNANPAFADIDNDGDYDLAVGDYDGYVEYFRNDGTASSPSWTHVDSDWLSVDVSQIASPVFVDIDNDSDYDLVVGDDYGKVEYFRNDGTVSSPSWTHVSDDWLPVDVGGNAIPAFADIDNDEDYDLVVGNWDGYVNYFRNDGTVSSPSWTHVSNDWLLIDMGYRAAPAFADIDNDGDSDLAVGDYDGYVEYFRNDSVYQTSGDYNSQAIYINRDSPDFTTLEWTETVPANTTLQIQMRSASTEAGLSTADWYGPTATDDYYTTNSGETINSVHDGDNWFQYKVYFTSDGSETPIFNDITINYEFYSTVIVDSSGNLGIGKIPTEFFDISGNFKINESGYVTTGTWQGDLIDPTYGGTGLDTSSAANGELLIGNGSGFTLATLTDGTGITITEEAGSISIESTLGTDIDLTSEVTGILPAANGGTGLDTSASTGVATISSGTWSVDSALGVTTGGTGTTTQFTEGSLVFAGASGVYSQDNSNLFWDDTNDYLGIGTNEPGSILEVYGGTTHIKEKSVGHFDISRASLSHEVSGQEFSVRDIEWSDDGTKFYELGNGVVYEYDASTAFDITTLTYSQSLSLQSSNSRSIAWNNDGTKFYEVGDYDGGNKFLEYNVSTPFDISTATYSQSIAVQSTNITGMAWNNDGTKLYEIDSGTDKIYEHDVSTPFDISTATYSQSNDMCSGSEYCGIAWNNDGTKLYEAVYAGGDINEYDVSTPFDVSTATFSQNLVIARHEPFGPFNMTWNNDGSKMYECSVYGDFAEYDLDITVEESTLLVDNYVGIGDSTPASALTVGDGDLFQVDSGGIIQAGTWQGDAINPTYGGTGLDTSASTGVATVSSGTWSIASTLDDSKISAFANASQGDILYYNGASWTQLAAGTSGQYLETQGAGANPQWSTVSSSQDEVTLAGIYDYLTLSGQEITLSQIDLTTDVTGLLPATNGGTGLDTSSAANGELLIGNGSGLTLATLTGTSNQINVSNGSGSITLSTPQDIATTSSPTFAGLTTGGNIVPDANNSYDIGTSTNRFQEIYLGSTGLHIGADGDEATISYNTDTDKIEFSTSISSFSMSGGFNIEATDPISYEKLETDDTDFGAGTHSNSTTSGIGDLANIILESIGGDVTWAHVNSDWLVDVGDIAAPSFVDIDDDGDYDLIVGDGDGLVEYFRNDGTASSPSWTHVSSDWLPVDIGNYAKPALIDIDDDGDYDLVGGDQGGLIDYFRNDGTASSPSWTHVSSDWLSYDVGGNAAPNFADIDNDGDYDLVVGDYDGLVEYFRNDGTASSPSWTHVSSDWLPADVGYGAAPSFADIDNDGDYDLAVGESTGYVEYFRNDGTASSPSWTHVSSDWLPADVGFGAAPSFADIDNDGDYDLVVGDSGGLVEYFRNDTAFQTSGSYISQAIYINKDTPDFTTLEWTETVPANTTLQIQMRSASTEAGLTTADWYGPTAIDDYYTTNSGEAINSVHDGDNWFQYKVYLTSDGVETPVLDDITINYDFYSTITVDSSGNFGIGVIPSEFFDVFGNFKVDESGYVTTGTWQGDLIDPAYGGTGLDTSASTGVATISSGTWSIDSALGVTTGGTGTTTQFTQGSLVFAGASGVYSQDNANLFWDDTNKRLGIGDSAPSYTLTVDHNGDGVDFAYVNDSNAWTNGAADYAEYFYTEDTDLQSGEAVCVNTKKENTVKRCDKTSDPDIMGIVSTNPAVLGNAPGDEHREDNPNYVIVGMLGQVPAKITTENGEIQPGDSLAASSKPGYLMKANPGDSTVGVALEKFTIKNQENKKETINVLISRKNKTLTVEEVETQVTERITQLEIEDQINQMIDEAIQTLDADSRILEITQKLKDNNSLITDLQDQVNLIQEENNAILDFMLAVETDSFVKKDSFGNVDLLGKKLTAGEVVSEKYTVKVNNQKSPTIGTATILPVKIDENNDGIDDETGSDGKSVVVKTEAVEENSKIFVTPDTEEPILWSLTEKKNGESFRIKVFEPVNGRVKFDWWIVKKDKNEIVGNE